MSKSCGTILVTTDEAVVSALGEAFEGEPLLEAITVCDSIRSLAAVLERHPGGLVIVDIEPDPGPTLATMRLLVDTFTECRFIVLAPDFDKAHLLESMQVGARHFLPKDWIGPDVVPICRELAEQVAESTPRGGVGGGVVLTTLQAGGGVGATTLAVNVAAEMAERAESRSLVVDLDLRFGGVATHLGLSGEYGIADLLGREEPLDAELVRSTAAHCGDRLDVLLSPASIGFDDPTPLYLDRLEDAFAVFRSGYTTTVLDAPSLPIAATLELARQSTAVRVALNLSVKDPRHARMLLESIERADIGTPVHVFANRCKGAGKPISLSEAGETLGLGEPIVPLADDPIGAAAALHAGQPLLKASAKSKLRKSITAWLDSAFESGEAGEAGGKADRKRRKRKAA